MQDEQFGLAYLAALNHISGQAWPTCESAKCFASKLSGKRGVIYGCQQPQRIAGFFSGWAALSKGFSAACSALWPPAFFQLGLLDRVSRGGSLHRAVCLPFFKLSWGRAQVYACVFYSPNCSSMLLCGLTNDFLMFLWLESAESHTLVEADFMTHCQLAAGSVFVGQWLQTWR